MTFFYESFTCGQNEYFGNQIDKNIYIYQIPDVDIKPKSYVTIK